MKNTGAYDSQYFKSSKGFQTNPERAERFSKEIRKYNPERVLDVGCGPGTLVKLLRSYGIKAYGIDNAKALKELWKEDYFSIADAQDLPFEDKDFDIVFSSDFFEHIQHWDIDRVAKEMKRVGKVVIAEIAFQAPLTERQKKYHVTNKPRSWWEQQLPGVKIL